MVNCPSKLCIYYFSNTVYFDSASSSVAAECILMFMPWCATTGSKYELPKYVLSDPSNLVSERDSKQQSGEQLELTARRI